MTDLERCIAEQAECGEYLRGDTGHKGAMLGASDWVKEEAIIRRELKGQKTKLFFTCSVCDFEFSRFPSQGKAKLPYCSNACVGKSKRHGQTKHIMRDVILGRCLLTNYSNFLLSKRLTVKPAGFKADAKLLNSRLFEFQRDITVWALKKGKSAIFADCGTGKTIIQLEWAAQTHSKTGCDVLIFAPLAVSQQTAREGDKFGIKVNICRNQGDVKRGINITNYEMLEQFQPSGFAGIVLDESSILKGDGPLRKGITEFARTVPYRLACTATPAPNDHMELGNHAEFLGIMSKTEMLSTFFVHDGGDTSKWRLKGHAEAAFWKWVASWAVMIRKPSDLGYSDEGFVLPPLHYHQHTVSAEWSADYLFPVEAKTMQERQAARRDSLEGRAKLTAELVNASPDQWILWTNLNDEGAALARLIPDCVRVKGDDPDKHKIQAALDFIDGKIRVIESKGRIYGWGMNYQHCWNAAAVGLSDSWETLYQITRRTWRYGQTHECHMHLICGELEGAVSRNVERKEKQAAQMAAEMLGHMRAINAAEIHGTVREQETYKPKMAMELPNWL